MNMNGGLVATIKGDETELSTKCSMCGKVSTRTVPTKRWREFEAFDGHVQDFWPDWSDTDREHFFMPGATCPDCWAELFPPPTPEGDEDMFDRIDIEFNGKKYPGVNMYINDEFGCKLVSMESLEKELLTDEYLPVSEKAGEIDDEIFYYVPDSLIEKDAEEIRKHIEENVV